MQQIPVQFCWFAPESCKDLSLPAYETALSAGMDIAAAITETIHIKPGEITLIPTGFGVAIPGGYEIQIRPRSGLAVKCGITIINSPGTIDADYRGEVKVGLINLGKEIFTINRGDRIAQMVLAPVCQARLEPVTALDTTGRGSGGFGHTGI
ncbi:MAG: dUTP diphosphatase [Desulfobulbus sp.]|nr:MAG: dUTP diphosphatase [Desulfobulbus sp.]RUM35261.1 MAG: dUTP diphosphatase [Desulfobulbus sp.]RUM40367.1 MAG: dUTP diphosphatase [Desulfobulbus sp.]